MFVLLVLDLDLGLVVLLVEVLGVSLGVSLDRVGLECRKARPIGAGLQRGLQSSSSVGISASKFTWTSMWPGPGERGVVALTIFVPVVSVMASRVLASR